MFDAEEDVRDETQIAAAARRAARLDDRRRIALSGSTPVQKPLTYFLDCYEAERRKLGVKTVEQRIKSELGDAVDGGGFFGLTALFDRLRALAFPIPVPGRLALVTIAVLSLPVLFHAAMPATSDLLTGQLVRLIPGSRTVATELYARFECAELRPVSTHDGDRVGWRRQKGCDPDLTPELRHVPFSAEAAVQLVPFLDLVEGETSGPWTLLGLNIKGLLRAGASAVSGATHSAWSLLWTGTPSDNLRLVGGSNAITSGIEQLRNIPSPGILGKLASYRDTMFLTAWARETVPTTVFGTSTTPCLVRHGLGPIRATVSGAMCLEVFGRASFDEMSIADKCLWASSAHRPLVVIDEDAPAERKDLVSARLAKTKERAQRLCIDRLEAKGVIDRETARVAAEDVAAFEPIWPLDADIEQFLEAQLPGSKRAFEQFWPGSDRSDLVTTLRPRLQKQIASAANSFLRRVADKVNAGLCTVNCEPSQHAVDLMIAVSVSGTSSAGAKDELVALYETRSGLFGAPNGRPITRSLASIPKLLQAITLAEAGVERICPRSFANLQDYDGFTGFACQSEDEFWDPQTCLARSSNLCMAEAARLVGTGRVASTLRKLGAGIDAGLEDSRLRRGFATGTTINMTPQQALRAFALLDDARPDAALTASLLTPFEIAGSSGVLAGVGPYDAKTLDEWHAIAAAPFRDDGTMGFLRAPLEHLGCTALRGKSGTSDSLSPQGYRDRLTMIGATCGGKRIRVFVLTGSPRIEIPFGSIPRASLAALVTDIFTAIQED